ncbi:N-alpha-acetyltransferase 30 [Blastocladiella emersonii ATCC 22665]|nr:N-alpha-acetyltransferase 30 [Blastocladiella emersonii ATCC 22665]
MPVSFHEYEGEHLLPEIAAMIEAELSEPYSVYTYRYFLQAWPQLTLLCRDDDTNECIGVIVCKMDPRKGGGRRGYIGMLAVARSHRKHGLGTQLVQRAISRMKDLGADEIALEAESTNHGALRLYENLGFLRDKRLTRYYLSGNDAFRLKLWLHPQDQQL